MLLVILLALFAQDAPASDIRALEQMEQRLAATWQAGECDAWGAMLSSDWSVTHIDGNVMSKRAALNMCRAAKSSASGAAFKIDDVLVRVFGETAVVTGRTRATIRGAKPARITLRFTDIFVRSVGTWLVVASQATRVEGATVEKDR